MLSILISVCDCLLSCLSVVLFVCFVLHQIFHSNFYINSKIFFCFLQNERNSLSVAGVNMRTTSSVESLHAKFNRSFPSHGNIFNFLNSLKLFEYSKVTDFYRLTQRVTKNQLERKRPRDKQRNEKIRQYTELLERDEISVYKFLKLMAEENLPSGKSVVAKYSRYAIIVNLNLKKKKQKTYINL